MNDGFMKRLGAVAVLAVFAALLAGGLYLLSGATWLSNQKLQLVNGILLAVCTVVQLAVKLLNKYIYRGWLRKTSVIADIVSIPLWLFFLAGILAA